MESRGGSAAPDGPGDPASGSSRAAHRREGWLLQVLSLVLGGLGRLVGLWLTGVPSLTMLAALGMELGVTPLLCLWQTRIANARDRVR